MANINEFANTIYEMTEVTSYNFIEMFEEYQKIDETITYVYIKAFYMHTIRLYLEANKNLRKFDELYYAYKMTLENYYKSINRGIAPDILESIKEAFDTSFDMMQSLKFKDLYDGYEFRHHIVDCFELLRNLLESKTQRDVRVDLFENYKSTFRRQADTVIDYVSKEIKRVR